MTGPPRTVRLVFLTLTLIILFAAAVQQAAGFGFALVATPLLTFVVDAHAAVVLAMCFGFAGNVYQAVGGRRQVDKVFLGRVLAGALVGLPGGWWVYSHVGHRTLQVTIAVSVVVAVLVLARGVTLSRASRRLDVAAGVLTGALTTCTGTNGPPLVTVMTARRIPPEVFRATAAAAFLLLDVVALGAFAASGHLNLTTGRLLGEAVPGMLVGTVIGVRCRRLLNPVLFRRAVLALLAVTACAAVLNAVR